MGKFMAIDGNSLVHRAFHALPPMNAPDGTPTQAVYGFFSMLIKAIEAEEPTHLLVAFDTHAPTPRHIAYDQYKAGRKATPDDLRAQFPIIRKILEAMGIAVCAVEGFEADDILGIFSIRAEDAGLDVLLVTGDRDALQLVSDKTHVMLTKKGITETQVFDLQALFDQYGVMPKQMLDVKGLMGDSSDNIPGIPGVGEKTALKLVQNFGDLENVLAKADQVQGDKLREKLVTYADQARMSRELGKIVTDVDAPVELCVDECAFDKYTMRNAREELSSLALKGIISRLPKGETSAPATLQEVKKSENKVDAQEISDLDSLRNKVVDWKKEKALTVHWDDELTICCGEKLWKIALQKDLLSTGIDWEDAWNEIIELFSSEDTSFELCDAKNWMHEIQKRGGKAPNVDFDAVIAAYLLHPTSAKHDAATLISEYSGLEQRDAYALHIMCAVMREKLRQQNMEELLSNIEMPLISVLFEMESDGFTVDRDILKSLGDKYGASIASIQKEIFILAGEEFNILSPKQLGAILFEKMKLPALKKTKTGYSTDAETLESLSSMNPIVDKVLDYRQNTKLKSTYIDGLLNAADSGGKVHTSFDQTGTATGRISSSEPNLQNIPVRTEMGREIRKAFIASEGNLLVGADYSQIELRVLAHIADDEVMIDSFLKGEDIHARTAAEVARCQLSEVTSEMRSAAKAVNFGIVYGISDFGLSRQLGISRKQAGDYIAAYLDRYIGVSSYMKEIVESGKSDGYVSTLFGRRRNLPELKSSNFNTRSFGERAAMNTPIQGTAADIIKLAMIKVRDTLSEKRLKARLILQVHDELIVDTPHDEALTVCELVKDCMENVIQLKAPLVADVRSGKCWYDTK